MGVTIVTDSGSDLGIDEAARAGVDVVPVWIVFGDERLRDGIDIDRDTLISRIGAGDSVITRPPDPQEYAQVFARSLAAGNDVVALTLSAELSKSYEHASLAAKDFSGRVHVVNSRGAAGLQSLIALYAAELARAGIPAEEIARRADPARMKTAAFFAVPDLTQLGRSGRLPKAMVALGSMLNVSLVLKINEQGAIGPGGQSFSFEKTCEIMLDAVLRTIEHAPGTRIAFAHSNAGAAVARLSTLLAEKLGHPPEVELVHELPATLIANAGSGGIGIFAIVVP